MDLKSHNGKYSLHMIDPSTRLSSACVIPSKNRDLIIPKALTSWISMFGSPKQILADNGGEFSNENFQVTEDKWTTIIRITAVESRWSNGIDEQNNRIIANMIDKVFADTKGSLEVAVDWAVSAKNALANVFRYSPDKLIFGKNFPLVLTDTLPALESKTTSDVILENLKAVHSTKKAFTESKANERLRCATKHQTSQSISLLSENGDSVCQ